MRVTVMIEGREAIPVRGIPFVTGWTMSPDVVASSLAQTDRITRLRGVTAYHLSENDVAPMLPKEWDGVEAELEALSDKLKAIETVDQENYPTWRRESIPLLPPACFLWRDEFEQAFKRAYAPGSFSFLVEREGERELNFLPRVPAELAAAVMEGFAAVEQASQNKWPWGDYETPLLRVLAATVDHWCLTDDEYPQKKSCLVQEWIEVELKKAGIPVSKSLIDHIETIISPRVYSHTRQRVKSKE